MTMAASTTRVELAGRHARRPGLGCWTCKDKKVRCDAQQPVCNRCDRLNRSCDYSPRQRKPYPRRGSRSQGIQASRTLQTQRSLQRAVDVDFSARNNSSSPRSSLDARPNASASSLIIGSREREAIQYFQTVFARHQHTKNSSYNVVAVIFRIASHSAMTMHMVLAIARQEMLCFRAGGNADVGDDEMALHHYSEALRQFGAFIEGTDTETGIDAVLAATWLMLAYEQKFGDGSGKALSSHLRGVASLVQVKSRHTFMLSTGTEDQATSPVTKMELSATSRTSFLPSLFSARMLVWISLLDAGASSTRLGGGINGALHGMLRQHNSCSYSHEPESESNIFRSYTKMQRFSNPLFPRVWGDSYPTTELMDDIDNHNVFLLYGQCFQLRYMVSQLYELELEHSPAAADCRRVVEMAFDDVSRQYSETFLLARKMCQDTDHKIRAVKNVRFIVPHFHAATLFYHHSARLTVEGTGQRASALAGIMNLAFQAFQHEGDEAMLRIAWPLFMAILETEDLLHRDWVCTRLRSLARYGRNYARAATFADAYVAEVQQRGHKPDFRELLGSGGFEQFAI
ncbi:uncharacterized protein HMPREF1541_09878 [Cyphellophora europaea CBS 101466]|uniref:Zn(2)-C6 fungal-type domain-containing protein n=1 Tax=Cyphellophora europaea (strain CBS 101466) TaxID=1220924 RepID=W2S8K2_CYPE1|nr:uncharacterized protein HMPREF1541_09878 [Cyphellophora europaea CBS 101466]ETN45002.1 hypothetical protein HMPREF1541_09878 [Cyphellophora europaea CBS 101466]